MTDPDAMRRARVTTKAALGIAAACLVMMGLFVLDDARDDSDRQQEAVDSGYVGCLRFNENRELLRDVIEDAYLPDEQGAPPAEVVAAFAGIDDPDVATIIAYFTQRDRAEDVTDPASTLNVQRDKTATRNCEAEFADHTPGLALEDFEAIPPPPLVTPTTEPTTVFVP